MSNVVINDQHLKDIANAIRNKNGSVKTYKPIEMAPAINALTEGGGSGFTYEIVDWATGTDAQIQRMVEAADKGLINLTDYWHVGDERQYTHTDYDNDLNERQITYTLVLMDCNELNLKYYPLVKPTESGRTYGSFIIGFKEILRYSDNQDDGTGWGNYKVPYPHKPWAEKDEDADKFLWYKTAGQYTAESYWRWEWSNAERFLEFVFSANVAPWLQAIVKRVYVQTDYMGVMYDSVDHQCAPNSWFVPDSCAINCTSASYSDHAQWEYYQTQAHRIKKSGPDSNVARAWLTRSAAGFVHTVYDEYGNNPTSEFNWGNIVNNKGEIEGVRKNTYVGIVPHAVI